MACEVVGCLLFHLYCNLREASCVITETVVIAAAEGCVGQQELRGFRSEPHEIQPSRGEGAEGEEAEGEEDSAEKAENSLPWSAQWCL